jgi:chitinase
VVCYYTNWSQYRPEGAKFFPESMEPKLCTHIIFAFGSMNNSKVGAFEWNDDDTEWSKGMYTRMMALKSKNPKLKISLAIGGWNTGPEPFSTIVHDENLRSEFISSTIEFLKQRKFDGLDLE